MNARDILPLFQDVRPTGDDKWIARCPSHEDSHPSLSLRQAKNKVLVYCHAGCSLRAISDAIGLRESDWFDGSELSADRRPAMEYAKLQAEAKQALADATWREIEDLGRELRRRDRERLSIVRQVQIGVITEEEAMKYLAPIYHGYSEMEYRFLELLKRT